MKADLAITCPRCQAPPGEPCVIFGTIQRAGGTHLIRKRKVGHPVTTNMAATPPIHYRVSAAQYADLEASGAKRKLSPSAEAKRRAFARRNPHGT